MTTNDENHYTAPDGKRYVAVLWRRTSIAQHGQACHVCERHYKLDCYRTCNPQDRLDNRNIIWKLETEAT